MRLGILNPFVMVFFVLTRIVLRISWTIYAIAGGLLRVLWIPVKGALYVLGGLIAIGAVAGVILLAVHGGHLHSHSDYPPERIFGK